MWLGTGFGAGRAWEEADGESTRELTSPDVTDMLLANFRRGDRPSPVQDGLRRVRNER